MSYIEHCDECGNEIVRGEPKLSLERRFYELHEKGSVQFGFNWLNANEQAVRAAVELGVEYDRPLFRTLLSEICFRILNAMPLQSPDQNSTKPEEDHAESNHA